MRAAFLAIIGGIGCLWTACAMAQSSPVASLELQSVHYISDTQPFFRDSAASQNTSLDLDLKGSRSIGAGWSGHWNFSDLYSTAEQWNYVHPRDLYVQKGEFSFGQRRLDWSSWETTWHQGVFQPRLRDDKLATEPSGLVGFYWRHRTNSYRLTLGFLPAYIPELGPHESVENNKFVSKNPWFHPPVSGFQIFGVDTDIHYKLDTPPWQSVVFHPGAIGQLELPLISGARLKVTSAYKPMAQILFGFPSDRHFYIDGTDRYMLIEIKPRVFYDATGSAELSKDWDRVASSVSVTYDHPVRDNAPSTWVTQEVQDAMIASARLDYFLQERGPHASSVYLSGLKIWGGDAPDRGLFAGDVSFFETRFDYTDAVMAGFQGQWSGWLKHPIRTDSELIYDFKQNAAVFSASVSSDVRKNLALSMSMNILGLVSDHTERPNGFLVNYRANDRFGMGMTYVF